MKKVVSFILSALLLGARFPIVYAAGDAPSVSAKTAVVMDADSGRTIFEKDADAPMLIASTTKIMTALVVLEHADLDAEVTVDAAWTGIEGSSMYLKAGQKLSVRDLLYGLMLASGNDAAVALACVTAGSVEAFAALMNEKAQTLGCRNTHFMNANGLDDPEHYASARDLAVIMCSALAYDDFRQIVSATSKTVGEQTYVNHNRLLRECPGVFGGKTGFTKAAGRTLVTCCERNGATLICVTLSDPDDWDDHKALYNWAYGAYARDDVLSGRTWSVPVVGGVREEVLVAAGEGLYVLHRAEDEIQVEYRLPSFVYAQVQAGNEAGEAVAYIGGVEAGRTKLVYAEDVPKTEERRPSLWERVIDFIS